MSSVSSIPAVDAVIFDLDGTLIDSRSLYMEAYRLAVHPFIRDDLTDADIKALKPTSEMAFLKAVVGEQDFDACLEVFYQVYRDLHVDGVPGVYAGVEVTLEAIRDAGLPLGLVSGKSRRSWEITREAATSLGSFDTLVFDDDVRAPKPDPHGLEIALDQLGVDPGRAVYVGDTLSDMEAARAAGLRPIAALWAVDGQRRDRHLARVRHVHATPIERPAALLGLLGLD
jgi:pyrophosphatase PpaX